MLVNDWRKKFSSYKQIHMMWMQISSFLPGPLPQALLSCWTGDCCVEVEIYFEVSLITLKMFSKVHYLS
jgi:hypothetical protein